jgi:hypothetical protein
MAEMKMHEQADGDLWTGRVLQRTLHREASGILRIYAKIRCLSKQEVATDRAIKVRYHLAVAMA